MFKLIFSFLIINFLLLINSCSSQTNEQEQKNDQRDIPGWKLVWADEFDNNGLPDPQKWGFEVAAPGWVNNEAQAYTDKRLENARVENGKLIIEARMDNYQNNLYTSARLVSRNRGDWTYGRFEIRAKLPYGRGTWPAIWMMPTISNLGNKGWPDNGEIDIMEHVGYDPGTVHASTHCNKYVHTKGTQKTATTKMLDVMTTFHKYILEWDASEIKIYLDDKLYFVNQNENKGWEYWPFFKDFYFVLNIAIGGNWGGAQGIDNNIFPQKMEIDYVRVYSKAN